MRRTTSPTSISRSRSTPASISARVLLSILAILFPMQSPPAAIGQTAAPEVVTAKAQAEATIRVADALVGKAIATRNFDLLRRYWSPTLIVNNPANLIVGREQIIDSMNHGGLNYTSIHAVPELFTLTNGIAVRMSHENLVMAAGPMAGKHLVRRATEIFERSGDDWLLIARQATYLGFDGAILAGFVPTTYTPPPPTAEITAIHAQIDANSQAVGRAIHTMDFASLAKFWSPALVVNSPGNRILTRDQVFTSMREDKLKYSSAKAYPDAFCVIDNLAISMGHEDIVMAEGPMAGKPLKRRYTDIWQKTGDAWLLIVRQATFIGIDGGAVYGHPDPSLNLD